MNKLSITGLILYPFNLSVPSLKSAVAFPQDFDVKIMDKCSK